MYTYFRVICSVKSGVYSEFVSSMCVYSHAGVGVVEGACVLPSGDPWRR